ncbi:hypothetical protein [Streptomyces sp. NPDC052693]|uniref:hypothetical protein n=1 Tax=Streptomyces sp. NPDC052693 TaxID=3155814 RepID=UPI00342C7C71
MEVARLVLEYLKALVWPATTLAIVYGFRSQLGDLIRRIKLLSAPGVDAEFSAEVIEASEEAEAAVISHDTPSEEVAAQREPVDDEPTEAARVDFYLRRLEHEDMLLSYAAAQPEAAVVAAWWHVEAELRRMEESQLGPHIRRALPVALLIQRLVLPEDIKTSLTELSKVRSRAAHAQPHHLSSEAARAYVRSCREMVEWLRSRGFQQTLW